MNTHTPGPWIRPHGASQGRWGRDRYTQPIYEEKEGDIVAEAFGHDFRSCTENATIIAAAPDMYLALKAVERHMDTVGLKFAGNDRTSDVIRTAIAKAEGQ